MFGSMLLSRVQAHRRIILFQVLDLKYEFLMTIQAEKQKLDMFHSPVNLFYTAMTQFNNIFSLLVLSRSKTPFQALTYLKHK
jgi:hypothetical protein